MLEKKEKICYIVDVSCPFYTRTEKKETGKIKSYTDLNYEILKIRKNEVTNAYIVLVDGGALGNVSKNICR